MTVHFSEGHFEIIVIQNQKLLLLTLWLSNSRRFLLCFVYCRAIEFNPENFPLELIGNIDAKWFF
jgi:hypothetical protein